MTWSTLAEQSPFRPPHVPEPFILHGSTPNDGSLVLSRGSAYMQRSTHTAALMLHASPLHEGSLFQDAQSLFESSNFSVAALLSALVGLGLSHATLVELPKIFEHCGVFSAGCLAVRRKFRNLFV